MYGRIALAFVVGVSLGCGGSSDGSGVASVDFTGNYAGTSTNGNNTCPGTWDTGQMADGQMNLVQSEEDVQFQAQGQTGLAFLFAFGSASFSGKVDGDHVEAVIVGSPMFTQGECSYAWKGKLSANLDGDTLTGSLNYTPDANGHADCSTYKVIGCSRSLTFKYMRPKR